MRRRLRGAAALSVVVTLVALPTDRADPARAAAASASAGTVLPGTHCPVFPADNVWNTKVTRLPVDPHSSAWLATMESATTSLHPDFGPGGGPKSPYGIPYIVVRPNQPLVHIRFEYASESDKGPYPFSAATPIEGGQNAPSDSDRHAIMVNPKTCTLYELWQAFYRPDGRSTAGSGAIWKLTSNHLRPAGWTSADAAGLPILPGLLNYAEVRSGHVDHAIRVTADLTDTRFVWPARHGAGAANDPNYPPMGARFRLEAGFSLPRSRCGPMCQTVITAFKQYGLILADNGSNWFFQGTADSRWSATFVQQLKQIPASAFQAVDEASLECGPNSGQARQPGEANGGCR